ncbi:MAG TPA: hypothetical protein VIY48_09290 [Candidatus Paceibacterota bacterium]
MKVTDLDWRDVKVRDAITAFSRIKTLIEEAGQTVERVFIHSRLVARGYVYAVEYQDKQYVCINAYDFDEALAVLPTYDAESFEGQVMGVPVTEDTDGIMRVMAGVFFLVSRVGMKRYP